jgi:hypothetical protein
MRYASYISMSNVPHRIVLFFLMLQVQSGEPLAFPKWCKVIQHGGWICTCHEAHLFPVDVCRLFSLSAWELLLRGLLCVCVCGGGGGGACRCLHVHVGMCVCLNALCLCNAAGTYRLTLVLGGLLHIEPCADICSGFAGSPPDRPSSTKRFTGGVVLRHSCCSPCRTFG